MIVEPMDEIRYLAERPGSAIAVDWSFERYLSADGFVSRSMLELLRKKGPAYFHAQHIAKTLPRRGETKAMGIGTQLHTRLLEPEDWADRVLVWDELPRPAGANGRAKAKTEAKLLYENWKASKAEWETRRDTAIRNGGIVIDTDRAQQVEGMAGAVLSHPFGAKMFGAGGKNETTILWHHEATGVLIRVRLDRMFPLDEKTRVIVDAKSTTDPQREEFAKSIANFGYHRQGAIYTDAARALFPGIEFHYVLAAVRNERPYEAAFYELSEEPSDDSPFERGPLALGREQYTKNLYDYASRLATGNWTASWQDWCQEIDVPAWEYKEKS